MFEILLTTTQALLGAIGGLALALLSIASTQRFARRGGRGPAAARPIEVVAWAFYLVAAAAIYVAFALREGGHGWMGLELGGLAIYSVLALLGARRPALLGLGWLLHAGWDVILHADAPEGLVPAWYRWACLGYDFAAAAYLARMGGRR